MNKVIALESIVSCLKHGETLQYAQNYKNTFDVLKKITAGYGKDASPIIYRGENLEQLPELFKPLFSHLKKPSVIVNGRSRVNGQGIFGLTVKDGNTVVGNTFMGLDLTKGNPILQFRGYIGSGEKKATGLSYILDTNKTGKDALVIETFLNRKLAKELAVPEEMLSFSRQMKGISAKQIEEQAQGLKEIFTQEGQRLNTVAECMPELIQIGNKTGKVTRKTATEAVNSSLRQLGYNPSEVRVNFVSETEAGGGFTPASHSLEFNLKLLQNHQDLQDVINHELTHMEDNLALYKAIGAKKFKKLVDAGENFDEAWYDKMAKLSTKKVDVNALVKELEQNSKLYENSQGAFARIRSNIGYINSPAEESARMSELIYKSELQQSGLLRNTKISKRYGQSPIQYGTDYTLMFDSISKALNKYGSRKSQKFNELYYQSLYCIDEELATLYSKFEKAEGAESVKLIQQINKIIEKKYGTFERLELGIMDDMRVKLGLQAFPQANERQIQALNRIEPRLAEIQKAMFEGRPKAEFNKLEQEKARIIREHFGSDELFEQKVSEQRDNILREILAKNA